MRWTIPVLFILIFLSSTEAQYLFSKLEMNEGLSSNTVLCLLRDSDGFLWLGTNNGLNRFDGSSVRVYNWAHHNYPLDQNEIVTDVVEIQPGVLLIGTHNGLLTFSSYEKKFNEVHFVPELAKRSEDLIVYSMVMDPLGKTWIKSSLGLCLYFRDTVFQVTQVFKTVGELERRVTVNSTMALDTVRKGIWLGTNHGLCLVDYTTGNITSHDRNPEQIPVFRDQAIDLFAVHPVTGDIWWTDSKDLLAQYRVKDRSIHMYNDITNKYGLTTGRNLFIDTQGRLWYSTWTGFLLVMNPTGAVSIYPKDNIAPYQLNSTFVHDMIEDKNGDIWLATMSGAARVSGSDVVHQVIELPFEYTSVSSMKQLPDDRLLIASTTGLIFYDKLRNQFTQYKAGSDFPRTNRIFAIELIDGEWWCGTGKGIWIFNPVSNSFRPFDVPACGEEMLGHSVIQLLKDSHGLIWFTTWGGYLYRYDPVTHHCIQFDGSDMLHGDLGDGHCLALKEDSEGTLWIGYSDKGLRIYNDSIHGIQKITHDRDLETSIISQIIESTDGQIWVSTWGDGLFKLDKQGNVLDHLTTQHGLTSNYTGNIAEDAHGRIWCGTTEGVHYFNPGALSVSRINFEMGPLGEDWMSMVFDEHFNYVAFIGRILVIDHTLLVRQENPILPLISAVSVFEEELPFSPLDPDLHLKYNQNFFSIDFSSPQHNEFPSLQYAYILEGFSPDWVKAERRLSAGFTNVPPGKYIFRVKSSDQNGKFYDEDRHFAVIIQPPFWKTTWFYILCSVIGLYLIFLWYRFVQHRREKKKSDQIIDYFANSVYSENSVNEICWDIARNCISQLGFEDCVVYLVDTDRDVLIQKAAFGPKNPKGNEIVNPIEIPLGKGIVGTVAQEGRALLIPDTTLDVRYIPDDNVRLSELAVPILHEQKVIGVIDSEHPQKNFFTGEHLKTLATIASISSFKIADAQTGMLARESALKLMEVNTLFAESQLKALRAQMNPHFVFNCLNSIQECIVMKKYGEASAYLNKFAKLFRLVLNNSGKLLITIDEEVEILTLYLQLEQMRFDNSFQYTVNIEPGIESDDILMPSMFLQPFVENALWHGLMHKTGERKLEISFHKVSDDIFSCSIKDNGVGRLKSAELKKQKIFNHSYESRGMKMNFERLEVLRHQGFHATLQIVDLENPDGSSQGTNVIAEFSNNFNYN